MSCQKVVNVLAVSSAVVSLAVVGSVGYVFVNKDAIVEDVKEQVLEAVLGSLGGLGGGLGGGDALRTGANDLPGLGADPALSPTAPATDAASL